jgi:RNA polymerase sigma-70 factor (ECF subfamily)
LEEKELVRRILHGDEKAQNEFFRLFRDQLYRTSVHFLGYQDPDAEDAVQEAFMIAFQKINKFEFRSGLGTWVTQICVFQCYKRLHKRHRAVLKAHEEMEILTREVAVEHLERQSEAVVKEKRLALLRRCMGKISRECRSLFSLRDEKGLSYADMGERLKIPIGTVMSRLSRCKEALKALMAESSQGELE